MKIYRIYEFVENTLTMTIEEPNKKKEAICTAAAATQTPTCRHIPTTHMAEKTAEIPQVPAH